MQNFINNNKCTYSKYISAHMYYYNIYSIYRSSRDIWLRCSLDKVFRVSQSSGTALTLTAASSSSSTARFSTLILLWDGNQTHPAQCCQDSGEGGRSGSVYMGFSPWLGPKCVCSVCYWPLYSWWRAQRVHACLSRCAPSPCQNRTTEHRQCAWIKLDLREASSTRTQQRPTRTLRETQSEQTHLTADRHTDDHHLQTVLQEFIRIIDDNKTQ